MGFGIMEDDNQMTINGCNNKFGKTSTFVIIFTLNFRTHFLTSTSTLKSSIAFVFLHT